MSITFNKNKLEKENNPPYLVSFTSFLSFAASMSFVPSTFHVLHILHALRVLHVLWAIDNDADTFCHWFQPMASSGFRHGQTRMIICFDQTTNKLKFDVALNEKTPLLRVNGAMSKHGCCLLDRLGYNVATSGGLKANIDEEQEIFLVD